MKARHTGQPIAWVALAGVLWLSACGKEAAPPAAGPATRPPRGGSATGLPAAGTATAGLDAHSPQELVAAYHGVRCALVGAAPADPTPFATRGFASAEEFSAAFEAFARKDPAAAEKAIADSYRRGCAGDLPAAGVHP